MYSGLAYKEWIKIRWMLLIVTGISLWTLIDLFLSVREYFEFTDPVIKVWESVIRRKMLIYSGLKYNVLVAGIGIALIQFLPETMKRRLRLLFHLPIDHNRSLYVMLAFGFLCLLFVAGLNVIGLVAIVVAYFPAECLSSALMTSAPWFLAGIAAYFGAVLVVVEPVWWRRVLYAAVTFGVVELYFSGRGYDTYAGAMLEYLVVAALYLLTVVLPAFRFKRGLY